jgi:ABC-type cobalamin/Fe3+-siderophores transport system ATPase subunit
MLELHNVTIGQQIRGVSATVEDGKMACIQGTQGAGKTTLLRAVMGFIPIDGGHISIDGELLTPQSAPYFRKQMAYVPQHLSLPDGYNRIGDGRWDVMNADERYLWLMTQATMSGKQLLIVDEPEEELSEETWQSVDNLLAQTMQRGTTVLMVSNRYNENVIQL